RAKLVLFSGKTGTACGLGESATGPFYCPGDQQAYIDLAFFNELSRRLGAPGDFAQAYVLAHEIGHHVQNLTGASARVHKAPQSQQKGANGLSVRLELQADCYAGVWAHSTKAQGLIEAGDLEEALTAAAAIGDDTLQRNATGTVRPETFSHGSSAQRAKWFRRGFDSGDPGACDTFSGSL
ncbi:MAG: neutral zinc metallopeptidase, partial [Myxococcales bacterium]|nr:neutral zinc metallopeptidase [Myxococcales bacterium]